MILVGYSGHGYVAAEILKSAGFLLAGYLEKEKKDENPFGLEYLGYEEDDETLSGLKGKNAFVSIGDNKIRENVCERLFGSDLALINAISPNARIPELAELNGHNIMVGAQAVVNPLATIEKGVILNTGCIVEHECTVQAFAHLAPGAVLGGNVQIGAYSLIGANSVIREGTRVGSESVVGAGSVVLNDIPAGETWAGNPARKLR